MAHMSPIYVVAGRAPPVGSVRCRNEQLASTIVPTNDAAVTCEVSAVLPAHDETRNPAVDVPVPVRSLRLPAEAIVNRRCRTALDGRAEGEL